MKPEERSRTTLLSWISAIAFLMIGQLAIGCQASKPEAQKPAVSKEATLATGKADSSQTKVTAQQKLIIYYFHGNMRCPTCYKLENYAKSVVETDFADAIKNGKIEWKTVNVEDQGNEHFSTDYKLYTKSVIISTVKDGKESSWKNLDQIWTLVEDQTKYMDYIRKEVKACLEGKCL
jgi:hypothetical protein